MCIKSHTPQRRAAFSLIEMLFFVVLATIVVVAGVGLATNFMRTVAFLTNTVDLDTKSRLAADRISREIRQCDAVHNASSNIIVLRLGTNLTTFAHDAGKRTLVRFEGDAADDEVILTGCDYVRFDLFQRQLTAAPYDRYEPATPANCKIVQLNWVCSRELLGFKANTTTMQSAKIVIRKK